MPTTVCVRRLYDTCTAAQGPSMTSEHRCWRTDDNITKTDIVSDAKHFRLAYDFFDHVCRFIS
jgi:hypothetical protein